MATREQTYITTVKLNGKEAEAELQKLEKHAKEAREAMDKAYAAGDKEHGKKLEKEWKQAEKAVKQFKMQTADVAGILNNLSDASIQQLTKASKALNAQLKNLAPNTEEFKQKAEQLSQIRTRLAELRAEGNAQQGWMQRMFDGLNRNWGAFTQIIGAVTGLTMTIRKSVQDYADMEEAMADVQKYTGMTTEEVHEMNEELKAIDTRTPREKLNALAGDAGRLGITGKENILEFVDAANKINVALGDDLGESAVRDIGKLADTFGDSDKMGLRGAMLATGSAVNELAQSSSAAAGYIVEFEARLGGAATQAGIAQTAIMGYASVLDQNMQQQETSATAMSQLITAMFKDPAKFAKLAGKNVTEFTNLLKKDANAAILQFLESMQKKGGFDALAPMFDEMGLSGSRCVGVLSTLATHLGDVKTAQDIAAKAFEEGISVLNEYDVQNNTEQAGIDKAKKKFLEVSIALGEKLLPVLQYTISGTSLLVKGLYVLVSVLPQLIPYIVAATASWTMWNAAMLKTLIIEKVTAAMKAVRVAIVAVNTAMRANPWMALATVLTMVVAYLWNFFNVGNKIVPIFTKMSDGIKGAIKWVVDINHRFQEWYNSIGPIGKALVTLVNPIGVIASKVLEIANNWRKARNEKEAYEQKKAAEDKAHEEQTNKDRERVRRLREQMKNTKYDKNGMIVKDAPTTTPTSNTPKSGSSDPTRDAVNRSKQILNEQNAALQISYMKGEILYSDYLQKRQEAEQENYERLLSIYEKDSDDYKNTLDEKEIADLKWQGDKRKMSEEEVQNEYETARFILQNTVMTEKQKKEALFELDQAFLEKRRDCYIKDSEEWNALDKEMREKQLQHQYELQQSYEEKIASFRKEYLQVSNADLLQYWEKFAEELKTKGLLTEEEYQKALKAIREKYATENEEEHETLGFGNVDDFTSNLSLMAEAIENLNKKIKDGGASWKDYAKIGGAALQSVMGMMNALGNLAAATAQAEIAATEAKYKRLIDAAEGNEEEQKRLEEKKNKEIKAIKLKQAESERGINVAQALTNVGLGIMEVWASWSALPAVAAALSAAVTAMGAIQVATINKQYEAQVASINSGYYEGGYTGGRRYRREAGIVHEGEFVANHEAVNNPEIRPMLDLIDQAQRNNTVGSLTADDLRMVAGSASPQEPPVVNVSTDNSDLRSSLVQMNEAVSKLNRQLADGLGVNFSMQEFKRQEKHYNMLLGNK